MWRMFAVSLLLSDEADAALDTREVIASDIAQRTRDGDPAYEQFRERFAFADEVLKESG